MENSIGLKRIKSDLFRTYYTHTNKTTTTTTTKKNAQSLKYTLKSETKSGIRKNKTLTLITVAMLL